LIVPLCASGDVLEVAVQLSSTRRGADRQSQRGSVNSTPTSRGYAHAYHERVISDIIRRAQGYRHRSRRIAPAQATGNSAVRSPGSDIRAKIAANAQKRYEIAEAMKAEAGVVDHQLTGELAGGIAWTDRAHILAPAGENRVQLATLAHECGHVFLHGIGSEGYGLPGHVKEMEAESYAHQAFAAHGMRMPAQITGWGRAYVGRWVQEDRAIGIPIDPRAEAYANGSRSPYEPLRKVPANWTANGRLLAKATPGLPFPKSWHIQKPRRIWQRGHYLSEARILASLTLKSMIYGGFFTHLAINLPAARSVLGMPPNTSDLPTRADLMLAAVAGIVCACVALSLATMVRPLGSGASRGSSE
jgi:hypothetical protein